MKVDSPAGEKISEQPPSTRRKALWAELPWLLAYVPLALAFTWPLAAKFTTELAGDHGDAWQNLWNIAWVRHALATGQNPFFTHQLWQPDGVTLVFQTFDLPDMLWSAGLLGILGPWPTYNLVILWAFIGSGLSMYALGRGTGASRPAAFLSGCAYTFSTYHFGHTLGHLHIVAMQWVPLYALAFWRVLEGGRWRWAIAGGVFLALSALSSWYYLLSAFVLSFALGVAWVLRTYGRQLPAALPRALVMCGVFLGLVGPLLLEMVRQKSLEHINGEHEARFFSADVQSFYLPNAAQWLAQYSHEHDRWTGNPAETTTYLGAMLTLLVLAGLFLRAPRVGGYVLAAVFGIVISLGPALHVGGHISPNANMPYAWIVKTFPILEFTGVPVRLAFVATFSLAAALAPALDSLRRKITWWAVAPLAVLAIVEHTPHPFVTSTFPTPAPMLEWAKDPQPFVVLDACRDMRHLWHGVLHGHPIMGGYVSRTPARLEQKLTADPVAGTFWDWDPKTLVQPLSTPVLDFPFRTPVVEGADSTNFTMDLRGRLRVTKAGLSTFTLISDDGAVLTVDGRRVVDTSGRHPALQRSGQIVLAEGEHDIAVRYEQDDGGAVLQASWAPPGEPQRLLGGDDVPGGFFGSVRFRRRAFPVSGAVAMAHLRELNVRYIVQPEQDSRYPAEGQLGLSSIYEGAGVRIYEIPPL